MAATQIKLISGVCANLKAFNAGIVALYARVGNMAAAVYDPTGIAASPFSVDNHVTGSTNKVFTATLKTKVDSYPAVTDVKMKLPGTKVMAASGAISAQDTLDNDWISNYGASGTVSIALPAISYNKEFKINVSAAQVMTFTPPTGEVLYLNGVAGASNAPVSAPTTALARGFLDRVRLAAGTYVWSFTTLRGTWVAA